MPEITSHDLLTVAEACQAVRLCQRSVYNLFNAGDLHAVKIGRRTFVRREEIDRFLADLPSYSAAERAA